ncbi:fimbrial protein [Kalamiella sp. sgz302252]|uniref:fimbrial protein n=1 Tax=Pantoea sp. sgz302252 TaxID=3341827 RepID=UPI0036D296F3
MKRPEITLLLIGLVLTSCIGYGAENNYNADMISGKLHLQGKVIAGACRVTSDNNDMHIELGRYDKTSSPANAPFTVKLADCQSEIISGVNIHFSGEAKSEMPNLFLTHSPKISAGKAGQRDNPGLLILDAEGKQVLPDSAPVVVRQEKGKDTELHYFARYFATSLRKNPGTLHSEVRLDIAYP